MVFERLGPRTSIRTWRAWLERKPAACPAEFPPPSRATSSSRQSRASTGEAQYETPRPSNCARFAISGRRSRAPPAVGKVEDEHWIRARALGSAVQLLHLGGEAELHPELLRLGVSARHQ